MMNLPAIQALTILFLGAIGLSGPARAMTATFPTFDYLAPHARETSIVRKNEQGSSVRAGATAVAFFPSSDRIVVGDKFGHLRVVDCVTGMTLWQRLAHRDAVRSVALSADGHWIFSVGSDTALMVTQASNGERVHREVGNEFTPLPALTSARHGLTVAATLGQVRGGFEVLDFNNVNATFNIRRRFQMDVPDIYWISALALSSNGRRIVSGDWSSTEREVGWLRMWDVDNARQLYAVRAHTAEVSSVTISQSGSTIASSGYQPDGKVHFWNAENGVRQTTAQPYSLNTRKVRFTPDGRFAIAIGVERETEAHNGAYYRVIGVQDGMLRKNFFSETLGRPRWDLLTSDFDISPDGSRIAFVLSDSTYDELQPTPEIFVGEFAPQVR